MGAAASLDTSMMAKRAFAMDFLSASAAEPESAPSSGLFQKLFSRSKASGQRHQQVPRAAEYPPTRHARHRQPRTSCSISLPGWILMAACPERIANHALAPPLSRYWRSCRKATHTRAALSVHTWDGLCHS